MCSHKFSGTVTFEHLISVTELKYKLGFIIYHVAMHRNKPNITYLHIYHVEDM